MFRQVLALLSLISCSYTLAQTLPPIKAERPNSKPQRIISLAPFITELAFSAGLGDKLVGVSAHSDYPAQAAQLPQVSDYKGIYLEQIINLEPDLILIWQGGVPDRDIKKLKKLGFKLHYLQTNPSQYPLQEKEHGNNQYSQTDTLQNIVSNIEELIQFADNPNIGLTQAKNFRAQLATLKTRYHTEKKVRYFYQLSEKPLMTFAQQSWPSDVFKFCGGENIFDTVGHTKSLAPYPTIGIEQVITLNPEVIFAPKESIRYFWPRWQSALPVIEKKHLWSLNADWLTRPTVRTLQAVEEVCARLEQVR